MNISAWLGRQVTKNEFARHVTANFSVRILSMGMRVGQTAIVAVWLGPEAKGIISLSTMLPNLLSTLLGMGVNAANVYYAGSGQLETRTLTANSLGLVVAATFTAGLLLMALYTTHTLEVIVPGAPIWLLMLGAIGIPLRLLIMYFRGILRGLQHFNIVNINLLIEALLVLILNAVFIMWFSWGMLGGVLAFLGAWGLSAILLTIELYRKGGTIRPQWDHVSVKTMVSFGLRGYFGNIFRFLNYRLDLFVVNYFVGPAAAGIYSITLRFAETLWFLAEAIGFVIMPKAASSTAKEMNRITPRICGLTLVLTMSGAVILGMIAQPVIIFLFSASFSGAYEPLLALLPGVVLLGGGKVLTNDLNGRGYPQFNAINSAITLTLTILFDLILIPEFGIFGAGVASSISYSATFFMAVGFYRYVSRHLTNQDNQQSG